MRLQKDSLLSTIADLLQIASFFGAAIGSLYGLATLDSLNWLLSADPEIVLWTVWGTSIVLFYLAKALRGRSLVSLPRAAAIAYERTQTSIWRDVVVVCATDGPSGSMLLAMAALVSWQVPLYGRADLSTSLTQIKDPWLELFNDATALRTQKLPTMRYHDLCVRTRDLRSAIRTLQRTSLGPETSVADIVADLGVHFTEHGIAVSPRIGVA